MFILFPQNIRNIKNRTSRHEKTVCLKNYSFRFCVFDDNALSSCKRWVNHHSPPKVYLAGACLVVSSWFQQWNTWNWRRLRHAWLSVRESSSFSLHEAFAASADCLVVQNCPRRFAGGQITKDSRFIADNSQDARKQDSRTDWAIDISVHSRCSFPCRRESLLCRFAV